ncbi:MAG: spore coat protein [Bacilli bacterium]|nr:spore coat protein [Bacilli bacterium]
MNNNMVQNPKTEVPSIPDLNDRDILNDILTTEKNMSNNYSIVLNEASNDFLYNELFKIYQETQSAQRELFNLLFRKGWYALERADANKINSKYQEYLTLQQEIQK